ncbi:MAG: right-handed parallel beta-helix repeat-containing protein [Planctomycetota bacterium]
MSTKFAGGGSTQSYLIECAPGAAGAVDIVGLHVTGGRGVHLSSGSLQLRNCLFSDNLQGVLIESEAPFGSASVVDCAFIRNGSASLAQAGGFGIYTTQTKGASFERCIFLANQAGEGGGLHLSHSASTITDCEFVGNSAAVYSGGAIARWWGHAAVPTVRSTFVGNSAAWGGTANWNCCIACTDCQFSTTADYSIDCDLNLIPDHVEMRVDPSVDSDSNGVLDLCEAPPCLGDLDASGTVTGVDLAIILQTWGVPSSKYPGADIDGDGLVGGTDLSIVLSNWGACP